MPFLKDGTHVFGGPTPESIKRTRKKWKGKTMAEMLDATRPGWRKEYSKEYAEHAERTPAFKD